MYLNFPNTSPPFFSNNSSCRRGLYWENSGISTLENFFLCFRKEKNIFLSFANPLFSCCFATSVMLTAKVSVGGFLQWLTAHRKLGIKNYLFLKAKNLVR
jgi:hypothetical protein